MRLLFGIVVDEEMYKTYEEKDYMINGKSYSLDQIENMAASKVTAASSRDIKEAIKVKKQIQNEIHLNYQKGDFSFNAAKHNDFTGYLDDLKEIQTKAAAARLTRKKLMDTAKEAHEKIKNDKTVEEREKASAKAKYLETEHEYKQFLKELNKKTLMNIENVRNEFEEHLTAFYHANGNSLDDAAIRLFQSGIKLKDEEIDRIVDQNKSNPTMLRVIAQYCKNHNINNSQARVYNSKALRSGEDERKIFNDLVNVVKTTVDAEDYKALAWLKKETFEAVANKSVDTMRSLMITPANGK